MSFMATPPEGLDKDRDAVRRRRKALAIIAAIAVIGGVLAVTQLGGGDRKSAVAPAAPVKAGTKADDETSARSDVKPEPASTTRVTVTVRPGMQGSLFIGETEMEEPPPWNLDLAPGRHMLGFKPRRGQVFYKAVIVGDEPLTVELAMPPAKPLIPRKPPRPPTGD